MDNSPIYCQGLGGGPEHVVDLRCPDCGPQAMDVIDWDRVEGVNAVRCPRCESTLLTNGTIPFDPERKGSRIRLKGDWTTEGDHALPPPIDSGEDDGQ